MLSKRVIALSADKAFGKRLAAGLNGAGASTEVFASLDELPKGELRAELVVVHVADDKDEILAQTLARLGAEARVIAVIPSSSIALTVGLMRQSNRVAAVMTADEFSPAALSAVTTRLLHGDVFGLEKVVPWGVRVYSTLVGDYQEKSVAIAAVSDFAGAMGVRRKYREAIEQCLDEMLMNALYDAPVDSSGKQMFADVPTKTRISLRMEQKAVVQYACEGNIFYLSVRDSFGALKGETVLKYLDKCLHTEQQIDRKAGGAGLGLYIISNATSMLMFNIYPGVATEAICTFDLNAPKVQLKKFGIFYEKIDSSGRLVGGPSKLVAPAAGGSGAPVEAPPAPASRAVTVGLGVAIALMVVLIGIVALPRLRATPTGKIAVLTDPPGAQILLDGAAKGTSGDTPLVLDELPAGQKFVIVARLPGHDEASQVVTPLKGATADVRLKLRSQQATLAIRTQPAGAAVMVGEEPVGVTPLVVTTLPPGSEQKITFRRAGYVDLVENVRVPDGGVRSEVMFALLPDPRFSILQIDSDPSGATVYQNGELLAGVETPVLEHLVQSGKPYAFTLKKPGYQPATFQVTVKPGTRPDPVKVKLEQGGALTVEVNVPEARITVDGFPKCAAKGALTDCALPNGKHVVRVAARKPFVSETIEVEMMDQDLRRTIELGFVETSSPDMVLQIPGAPANTRRAAFSDGTRTVKVHNPKTGTTDDHSVRVIAGRTVLVPGPQ